MDPKKSQGKNLRFWSQSNGTKQEIIEVEMSEEIQRNSERDGMGIMLKGKEEQIRRAKPRSKLRVYLP